MSKKVQFETNLKLSDKLTAYISSHPSLLKKHGESSYVLFVEGNEELNEMNTKLLENIKSSEKSVIKATHTTNKKNPWKFEFAY
jgi:hypothetical protein